MTEDHLSSNPNNPISDVVIGLLKGPLYQSSDPGRWQSLLQHMVAVKEYLAIIGLTVYHDESEGFAFVRAADPESQEEQAPRLLATRTLGYGLSVLCILLRKWLANHDSQSGELRAIIPRSLIHREMDLFLVEERSEKKRADRIDRYIKQAADLGLIKQLHGDANNFEIQRITKAIINAQWLGDLDARFEQYKERALARESDI